MMAANNVSWESGEEMDCDSEGDSGRLCSANVCHCFRTLECFEPPHLASALV